MEWEEFISSLFHFITEFYLQQHQHTFNYRNKKKLLVTKKIIESEN